VGAGRRHGLGGRPLAGCGGGGGQAMLPAR